MSKALPYCLLVCLLAFPLLLLPACGSDDPTAPGPPVEPEPTKDLDATVLLPADCPIPSASLMVRNGLGQADVNASGTFTLTVANGADHVAWVQGPGGNPVLAGWLNDGQTELSCRTTAEVLVYFALGAWAQPGPAQLELPEMIRDLTTELDPLEAAIAAHLAANSNGFAEFSQPCRDALNAVTAELLELTPGAPSANQDLSPAGPANPADKGLLIEPSAGASGIEVLNQGGLNSITLKNNWRRRVHVVINRKAYVQDGVEHASVAAVTDFKIEPIAGYAGVIGTISSWFSGATAYLPVEKPPVQLPNLPGADYTLYSVKSLGIGALPGVEADLTSDEVEKFRWVATECVTLDFYLPLFMNIIADAHSSAELAGTLRNPDLVPAITELVNVLTTLVPGLATASYNGELTPALWALWDAASASPAVQEQLMQFVCLCYFSMGADVDDAMAACDVARKFFATVGMIDTVFSYMDSAAMATMMASSNRADEWEVKATETRIALLPLEPRIATWEHLLLDCNVIDDQGGAPPGSAYSYHWICQGRAGALVNPIDASDPGLDFTCSYDQVQYIADLGVGAMDSVICEVGIRQGGVVQPLGTARMGIEVVQRTVSVSPDTARICPDGSWLFEVAFDPPFDQTPNLEYSWTASGNGGELLDQLGDPAPFTTTANWVDFHGDSDGGHSTIQVTAVRVFEGGSLQTVGTASADITVAETPMFHGETYSEVRWNLENHTVGWGVYVAFDRVPGLGRYHVVGHSFYDGAYYGDAFSCTGPPWPTFSQDDGSRVLVFLTGGGGNYNVNAPPTEEEILAWGLSRFEGAVWEITPVCP